MEEPALNLNLLIYICLLVNRQISLYLCVAFLLSSLSPSPPSKMELNDTLLAMGDLQ